MAEKTLAEMSSEEFEALLDKMETQEFGDLTTDAFFAGLAALGEEIDEGTPRETLELTATVKDGQLSFLEPAPLHAHGNEIRFGDKRIVIKLVPEEVPA